MCLSTKFKPKQHWKVITKNIQGKNIKVVPVWKVLRVFSYTTTPCFASAIYTNFRWYENSWNRYDKIKATYDFSDMYFDKFKTIHEGLHCYFRKSDAQDALIKLESESSRIKLKLVKMYTRPTDIIDKGFSFYSLYKSARGTFSGSHFKRGDVANSYQTLQELKETHICYPTLVTSQLFMPSQNNIKTKG